MKKRRSEIVIYLFFIVLAAAFWLFQAVNQTYEQELEVPLSIVNIPSNVVITSEVPAAVRVRVRDKGTNLLPYVYGRQKLPALEIDFTEYQTTSGHVRILTSELLKPLLGGYEFSILSQRPDTLDYYYNYGLSKRVPVRWQGTLDAATGHIISDVRLGRDSVLVYASRQVLDTITAAWLRPVNHTDITDTLSFTREIQSVRGAKFQPNSVKMSVFTDRIVEKSVEVPVEGVNFPAGKRLQTFPAQVTVTFQVGMKMYRDITAENFILVVNYEDLLHAGGNRCHLSLKSTPLGVTQVKIDPADVEFIIEDTKETSE